MDEYEVKIRGITMATRRNHAKGHTIAAYFDCDVSGLRLKGCVLVMLNNGQITVWAPRVYPCDGPFRSVEFLSDPLKRAVTAAAKDAFDALGGSWGCDVRGIPLDPDHPWNRKKEAS